MSTNENPNTHFVVDKGLFNLGIAITIFVLIPGSALLGRVTKPETKVEAIYKNSQGKTEEITFTEGQMVGEIERVRVIKP